MKKLTFEEMFMINGGRRGDHGAGLDKLGDYAKDPHTVGGGDYDSGRLQ